MSAPMEMAASVVPLPPPATPQAHKTQGVTRDDVADSYDDKPVEDAASVRAEKVSMANDEVQTAPEERPRGTRPRVDVMV